MQAIENRKSSKKGISFLENNYKIAQKNLALKKYQQIKMAIKELCYACKKNDSFPSIRRISKELSVVPVPVQRAITELIA